MESVVQCSGEFSGLKQEELANDPSARDRPEECRKACWRLVGSEVPASFG